MDDRIFSTSVDLKYTYAPFSVTKNTALDAFMLSEELSAEGTAWDGNAVVAKTRTATLEVFAVDESASVQVRLTIGVVTVHVIKMNRIGDALQDGRANHRGEQARPDGVVHPAQQALHPRGHALRRD